MFKNKHTTKPIEVQDGDMFAVKVVAVVGPNDDWAAYEGPTDWSDERVATEGDKLLLAQAEMLFYVLMATGRGYRG